jgi:AAA family ATP:ADP antiporter
MIRNFLTNLRSEYRSYSHFEKLFIFYIMLCSFLITGEASITRATANSVFLSTYTVKLFPLVWLTSVPLNFLIVSFYNLFLPKLGCIRMLILSICLAFCINLFSAFYLTSFSFLPFLLYLWKDIFIILMFQQLWSVIHATINIDRAKYLYGIFFGMGGLGSVVGSLVPGFLAVRLGSEKLLLITLPFYLLICLCYCLALQKREKIAFRQDISSLSSDSTDILGGIKLIHHSTFLKFILFIVVAMQLTSTLMDFQFCTLLEKEFAVQDLRTQFLGRFFGIVNMINVFLQFIGSFVLLRLIGLRATHLFVPILLGLNTLGFLIWPTFRMMGYAFGTIKCLDYSIFGIIKEMLYIPLKVEEKFKAKAIIDVFAYRTSKAFASIVILLLQMVPWIPLTMLISWGVVSIFVLWVFSILLLFKFYEREVERQHLNWPQSLPV